MLSRKVDECKPLLRVHFRFRRRFIAIALPRRTLQRQNVSERGYSVQPARDVWERGD